MGSTGIIFTVVIVFIYSILLIIWCFHFSNHGGKITKMVSKIVEKAEIEKENEKEIELYSDLVKIIETKREEVSE